MILQYLRYMGKRTQLREKGDRYCQIEVELSKDGRLSICGTEGEIIPMKQAKRDALEYWRSFFEESPEEIIEMNRRCGKRFTSALRAARWVIECDGELHGLDVDHIDGDRVYTVESCGQIRDSLAQWFPEAQPYMKWHLNDMRAGCEHQDELGWGYGRTIALDRSSATPAQLDSLDQMELARVDAAREKELNKQLTLMATDVKVRTAFVRTQFANPTIYQVEQLDGNPMNQYSTARKELVAALQNVIAKQYPLRPFEAAIYKDSIGCPCPTCGYRYGTEWLRRELPPEVKAWAEAFGR